MVGVVQYVLRVHPTLIDLQSRSYAHLTFSYLNENS